MANTFKRLNTAGSNITSATVGTVYTVPAATSVQLDHIRLVNQSGATGTIKIHHVASGGSANSANMVLDDTTMEDGDSAEILQGLMLSTGDSIQAAGDGTNSISMSIYGLVMD